MDLTEITNQLSAENLDERHAAVEKLALLAKNDPETIIPQIIAALKESGINIRWYLGRALIKTGPSVIPYLVSASEEETDLDIQKYYGAVLAAFGEEAVPILVGLFSSENPTTRGMSAASLERIGSPAVPALMEAAHSENTGVQLCARLTLAKFQIFDY